MAITAARLQVIVEAEVAKAVADLGKVRGETDKLPGSFDKAGIASTAMGTAIGIGAAKGVQALLKLGKAGLDAAIDLQQSVANISTIAPTINTDKVFAQLNEMSTRIPQSAAQLGDALYNIFSSIDVSADDGVKLLEKLSKGAVGAATDAQTFGTAVIGVMNAYKLSVADADHISDVFFNTVKLGVVTGAQLAAGLGPVTQSAKAMGMSFDELGGFIAGVTKEGGDAAQNINNLNNLLTKITTAEAQKALNDLGVKTVTATGAFRPMQDVLADLKVKLGSMTQAARANALQNIFPDLQAKQGAQTIISQLDFVNKAIADNKTAVGTTEEAYKKMSQTAGAQLTLLKNTLTATFVEMAAEILPKLTPLITLLAQDIPKAAHLAGSGFEQLQAGLRFVQEHSEQLKPVFAALAGVIVTALIPAVVAWTAATVASTAALVAQAAATAAAFAPVVALGAAAGILGRGLYDLATGFDVGTTKGEAFRLSIEQFGKQSGKAYIDTMVQMRAAGKSVGDIIGFYHDELEKVNGTWNAHAALLSNARNALDHVNQQFGSSSTAAADARARVDELSTSVQQDEARMQALRDALQSVTGFSAAQAQAAINLAVQQGAAAKATEAAAVAVQEQAAAHEAAITKIIPFGAQLDEIQKKAKSMAEAFDLGRKAIDDIANQMTAGEAANVSTIHQLELVGKAAEAAFSSTNRAAAADWTQKAKDAAAAAGLSGQPLKDLNANLDAIGKYGGNAKASLDAVQKSVEAQKKPLEDANAATSAYKTTFADAAKSQIASAGGMVTSIQGIQASIQTFVDVFLAQMGILPKESNRISGEMLLAFEKSDQFKKMGGDAGQAYVDELALKALAAKQAALQLQGAAVAELMNTAEFAALGANAGAAYAAGLRLQIADAQREARRLVDGSINQMAVSLDSHSPSRVFMRFGQWAGEGYIIGLKEQEEPIKRATRKFAQDAIDEAAAVFATAPALDSFAQRAGELAAHAATAGRIGESGAGIMDSIFAALKNPSSGAQLADAVNTLLNSDAVKHLPGAETLAANLWSAVTAFLSSPSPENLAGVEAMLGTIGDAVKAKAPTILTAFSAALSADAIAAQVGSSWASMFTSVTAAIDSGAQLPVQEIGKFGADVIKALGALPEQMRSQLAPQFDAAWQAFVANPSADALAALQAVTGQIHTAVEIIPKDFGKLPEQVQSIILDIAARVQDGSLDIEKAASMAGDAAKLIPSGFRRMLPEVQQAINRIVAQVKAGSLDMDSALERIADAQNLIPKGLHDLLPSVQNEIAAIVDAWQRGALSIEAATKQIDDAIQRGKDQAEAVKKLIEIQNDIALSNMSMIGHAPGGQGQTSTLNTGVMGSQGSSYGGSANISVQRTPDYLGVRGLVQEVVQDAFGTFTSYGIPADILANYGGNIQAVMDDLEKRLGVFMDPEKLKGIMKTMSDAATVQAQAAGAMQQASQVNAQNMDKFGGHVNDFGQIIGEMGNVLSGTPENGSEAGRRELDARRAAWERDHPGTPAPFASGGFIAEPSWLVSMRTGRRWGSIAEPGTGGEYAVPQSAMRSMMAAASSGGGSVVPNAANGGGSVQSAPTIITNHVNLHNPTFVGTDERKASDYIRRALQQASQRQG